MVGSIWDIPGKRLYIDKIVRLSLPTIVFPAKAGTQLTLLWIPAFAGMTDRVSGNLRDTRLANPGMMPDYLAVFV